MTDGSSTTPGVYINELSAVPGSVVPVATAIPAFIGYTARASYNGKSCTGVPVRIESFQQFTTCFGMLDDTDRPLPETGQYTPVYYPVPSKDPHSADVTIGSKAYDVEPDPTTIYYLCNSVKLFYANGGSTCYVLSVGPYGPARGSPKAEADPLVNPNVISSDLCGALATLERESEPTMIVIPDAVLLEQSDNYILNQAVLAHCDALMSRVGLLDIWHGEEPDPIGWMNDITSFRTGVGLTGLSYGIAYYPFLKTGVMTDASINYHNLGGSKTLSAFLPDAAAEPLKTLIANIDAPGPSTPSPNQIENALLNTSPAYRQLHDVALAKMNILPPSGAMAGAYALVDNNDGVWRAPANIPLAAVTDTTLRITDVQQGGLNVDAATGKSINAIRLFPGKGVVVWGARTLDGNSSEWRYINVRRTVIMIEQSMKLAVSDYVFEPNDGKTWSLIRSMLNDFLMNLWTQGALVGATPAAAFSVAVGLGTTMTAEDILQGVMNISVQLAVLRPAEFIVITIQQQMQAS